MRILFVCTGNICRSPMAAAIAKAEIERAGCRDVEVASAGIAALEGHPAASDACAVAWENGLSLEQHRARQLTPELLAEADLAVGMERAHVDWASRLGSCRAITLRAEDVPDPYGLGVGAHRETWTLLASSIPGLLAEHCSAQHP
ncbi:MAG TPA: low molecular weight protein-tyrosine-phosphatase [Gaiellaceae bacterium]|jgi:protein-tyrosine phosphatase